MTVVNRFDSVLKDDMSGPMVPPLLRKKVLLYIYIPVNRFDFSFNWPL